MTVIRSDTLRLETLQRVSGSYISESGEARYKDMVWKVRLADRWLYLYLLLEFQSRPDHWMALRMQVYVSLLLHDLQRQNQLSPEGRLPPVLPIVLYNGEEAWRAATDLADLLTIAPEALRPFQPGQRYLLIERSAYAPGRLDNTTNLVAALFGLEHSRTPQDMERVLLSLSESLAEARYASLRRDFSLFASWQLRRKVKDPTIPEIADLLEIRNMLEEHGLDWWERWKQEGLREGKREGEAHLLHRVLERRFGPLPAWADERLSKAAEEDLVRWGERTLDPSLSLEELLSN